MGLPSLLITVLNGFAAAFSPVYILILAFILSSSPYLSARQRNCPGDASHTSYNYGAGEKKRMRRDYTDMQRDDSGDHGGGNAAVLLAPGIIMKLFTADVVTVTEGSAALRIISLGFVVSGVSVDLPGALEALGKGFASLPYLPAAVSGP